MFLNYDIFFILQLCQMFKYSNIRNYKKIIKKV